jgi:hypothetical protein
MMFLNFIPMMLSGLMKYKRIVLPVLMVLMVLGLVYGVYSRGHTNGYAQAISDTNREKLETINENIDTRKKQDRVVPIDGKQSLISSLRDDTAL